MIPYHVRLILTKCLRLCWYVGDKYLRDFKSPSGVSFSKRVLEGILTLADFLVSEARAVESGNEQAKKEAKEQIPNDRVKDAPAVARELRWRVKQALGYGSDDEGASRPRGIVKRRRTEDEETGLFRNFKPRPWDAIVAKKTEAETSAAKMPATEGDGWTDGWTGDVVEGDGAGQVVRRRETVTKVRRTGEGRVERQRIERVVEEWKDV